MRKFGLTALALFLAGTVLLSACMNVPPPAISSPPSVSEPSPPSSTAPVPKETPKPYQADERFINDYNTLWSILENDYPFLGVAERETGKDFATIREKYHEKLLIPYHVNTPEQFFSVIVQPCLKEFDYVGHLMAIGKDEYDQRYARSQKNPDDKMIGGHEIFLGEQYRLPKVREFYSNISTSKSSAATNEMVAVSPQSMQTESQNLSFQYFPETATAYMSIKKMTRFGDNNDEIALKAFFEKISQEGYQHCIIDIRKNGGGSEGYWKANIVKPNLKESQSYVDYALIQSDRCREYVELYGLPVYPISELDTANLPRLNADDYKKAKYYWKKSGTTDTIWGRDENEPYDPVFGGDFWLLVGPRVYSASESFAIFCEETGFATLVGTTTGGDGIGLAPMVVPLPETGICIQFSAMNGLNSDGSGNEEFGTQPDIVISEGEDALTRCLEEIRRTDGGN